MFYWQNCVQRVYDEDVSVAEGNVSEKKLDEKVREVFSLPHL